VKFLNFPPIKDDYLIGGRELPATRRTNMTVSGVGTSPVSGTMERPPKPPAEITKSGLESMRDRITKGGGTVPAGLDTLIEKFDAAAGSGGKMTFEQFKSFAKENGVTIAEPAKSGASGGKPPAGGGGRAGAAGGGGASTLSSDDVTSLTDAELKALVDKGDLKAIRELQKREASRMPANDGVGQNVDEYV
jgi:hypothetical protein